MLLMCILIQKSSSRRLLALCVTLILPRVAMVIDKQFQIDQWQMVILMAWQFLVNNSKDISLLGQWAE